MNRRRFLKTSVFGTFGVVSHSLMGEEKLSTTPSEIEGPYYPLRVQEDKDFDLTQVKGRNGVALGEHIEIEGKVLDTFGKPVAGATVDLWQANAAGRYQHPRENSSAPLDENFQGWAILNSGVNGGFRFKTVLPGPYPTGFWSTRPPHIHFKVNKTGYSNLTTQMYFPDQELNLKDRILQRKSKAEQQRMIAKRVANSSNAYFFNIVIKKLS